MRYLKIGVQGEDVLAWEHFLCGLVSKDLVVDGIFTQETREATKKFQILAGFKGTDVDGVVGSLTLGRAAGFGFQLTEDESADESGPSWPPQPKIVRLSLQDREKLFGKFKYRSAPTKSNPEAIEILDDWDKTNIVSINVPQLKGVLGAPKSCNVEFHVKCAKQLQELFNAWEKAELSNRVLSWGGSRVSRYIRGSRTSLSNHSWGTAFDINVSWNGLGVTPALKGKPGSVRELVNIAYDHGFAWGGHFNPSRLDGMHFEIYRIIS